MWSNAIISIRDNYDRLAEEYARRLFDELKRKPLDCELLTRFAGDVRRGSPVCDMGCGPGHIARYLRNAGVTPVLGIDLSLQMIQHARRLNPDIAFCAGNMMELEVRDESLGGIAAFYAIVNTPRHYLPIVFREMRRVLRPGGLLLLAFHTGQDVVREARLWGIAISIEFYHFPTALIRRYLENAGFLIETVLEREPYAPEVEYQSRRAYIFARR